MKLPDEISKNLRMAAYAVKRADAYQDAIQLATPRPANQARVDMSSLAQEVARQQNADNSLEGWFDGTPFDHRAMRPARVWDPSVPMTRDSRYDDWWELPRRFLQRGPMTTSYDVSRYKPGEAGDYIIAFGGAGSGSESEDFETLGAQYGGMGNIARFTWKQIPEAVKYARSLPKGSRLYVVGHSMGGDAAYRFADELGRMGGVIAGMDVRDPVRIDGRLKGIVQKILPGVDSRRPAPRNVSRGVNTYNSGWFHNVNPFKWDDFTLGDVVSMFGGRYNDLKNPGDNWVNVKGRPDSDHVMLGNVNNTSRFPIDYRYIMEQFRQHRNPNRLKNPHAPRASSAATGPRASVSVPVNSRKVQ